MTFDYSKWDHIGESDSGSDGGGGGGGDGGGGGGEWEDVARMKAAVDDLKGAMDTAQRRPLHDPAHFQALVDAPEGAARHCDPGSPPAAAPRPAAAAAAAGAGQLLSVEALVDDEQGAHEKGDVGVAAFRGGARDEVAIRWRSGRVTVTPWPAAGRYRRAAPPRSLDAAGVAAMIGDVLRRDGPLTTRDLFDRFRDVIGDGDGQVDKEQFRSALHSAATFRRRMGLWEACFEQPASPPPARDAEGALPPPAAARPSGAVVASRGGVDYSRWDAMDVSDDDEGGDGGGLRACAPEMEGLRKLQGDLAALRERREERKARIAEIDRKYGLPADD